MNITVVSRLFPTPQNSVSGIFVLQQAQALSDRGHHVQVISPRPYVPDVLSGLVNEPPSSSLPQRDEYGDITVHYPRYWSLPRPETLPLVVYSFRRALYNHKELFESSDIINAHVALPSGFGSIPIAKQLEVPLITTIHGADLQQYVHDWLKKRQLKRTFAESDTVILNSQKLQQICLEEFDTSYNTTVIHNGIDTDKIKSIEPTEFSDNSFKVISVGKLIAIKGHKYVLEALCSVEFDYTYIIIGDGPQKAKLERHASKLGIRNKVSFMGYLDHVTVISHLKSADVFVLPSYNEAFGISYVEAMACGLPTIACEGEGPEDFISHRKTGFLVPPQDSNAVAQVIQELHDNPKLRQCIADRGQQATFNAFSWKQNAKYVEQVFRNAIRDHN